MAANVGNNSSVYNDKLNSSQDEHIHSFAKQMLQSRLFVGSFQEKRYVDALKSYRDVVVVANEETDLIRDLEVVKKRICGYFNEDYWVGITGPEMVGAPAGHCVWVELQDEIFGSYWYKISKIRFRENEMLLRLKIIRPVSTVVTNQVEVLKSSKGIEKRKVQSLEKTVNKSVTEKIALCSLLSKVFTIQNTKDTIKFLSVLLAALVTGAIQLLEYLGDFTIKFMRELSHCIQATSPVAIACINLIGKIIGGFYILILGMWRDRKGPTTVFNVPYITNSQVQNYNNPYQNSDRFRRSLPPPPGFNDYVRGPTITPLD